MILSFGETLRRLRTEKGLSQQQLAERLHVGRPSVTNWEGGRRMPDALTVSQLADALGVSPAVLLPPAERRDAPPNVVLMDDMPIIVEGTLPVLRSALPGANITGFTRTAEAVAYFKDHPVALVFLDIELGRVNGLDLCGELLRLQPFTNVVFLTAYQDYAYEAWSSLACGFLLKPLTEEAVRRQLPRLRHPVGGLL